MMNDDELIGLNRMGSSRVQIPDVLDVGYGRIDRLIHESCTIGQLLDPKRGCCPPKVTLRITQ
jgi:hypothetical protein